MLLLFWILIMANYEDKCFLVLFLKALSIKKKFKLYDAEKKHAKSGKEGVHKCNCSELNKSLNSRRRSPNTGVKKLGIFERFLNEEDSMRNFILKSAFGFIGGILLTYIFFIFLVFSLNFTLKKATYICMALGVILSLGLAFSVRIRCTVFLCIPQLFSKRGRQALLAYAFILALSGPAKNTLHNVEVMSESLACRQEQLRQVENEIIKFVQKPNSAAKKLIEKLLEKINFAVKDFKNFILELYKTYYDILQTVLHSQEWLYSITALCQKKTDRPVQRCLLFLQEASENCQGIYSSMNWKRLCQITSDCQKLICAAYETSFCRRRDVQVPFPVEKLQNHLTTFKQRALNILYVRVEAHQTYSQSNRSNIRYEEVQGVATEIRQKTDQFLQYFDFMSLIFGIFILVLFMKVIIYRYKFLTDDNYDNRYITHDFVDIDRTRAEFKMETLLPLEPREKTKYIKVTSIRLVPCEKVRLMSSFIFLMFASFKIIVHMLTDSSLYWILSNIRREEKLLYMSSLREDEPSVTVRVEGDGIVAALVRNVTKAVKRQSTSDRLDPTPCLPDPIPPDWNRYYQILALVVICWLLALCEPYGLRLRHTVMVTYHPDRARERAIWLYNQIISDRSRFLKLARRDIRKRYKDVPPEGTLGLRFFLKKPTPKCLLCRITLTSDTDQVKCPTYNCPGLFCIRCYDCLQLCSICTDPADYGDLSDVSEEKDSSEEENVCRCSKRPKKTGKSVQKTEKSKEGLELNFKKPSFCLDSGSSEKSELGKFLRPKFLDCISFSSKKCCLQKLKQLPDSESPSVDKWKKSSKCKIPLGKCDERKKKSKKVKKKLEGFRPEETDPHCQKLCLFQKVSEVVQNKEDFFTTSQESGMSSAPLPELGDVPKQSPKDDRIENTTELKNILLPKFSPQTLIKKTQESGERETKNEAMPQATDALELSKPVAEEIVPTPINVKYYEIKETQYPFIDPINIHEISHKWSESNQDLGEDNVESNTEDEFLTPASSRVRVRLPEDTSSIQESVKLTITEQVPTSPPKYKRQFGDQPSLSNIKLGSKKSGLKRTSGKTELNVNDQKNSDLYAIETDSSNERFLTVKPTRRVGRKRKRKSKNVKIEYEVRNVISCPKWTKHSKKVGCFTSKFVKFLKKKLPDRKKFGNCENSDVANSAIFLSDEEFERLSKNLRGRLGL